MICNSRERPRAIRKLYRRFLFYKYFIALEKPIIVTEGKTDPIYIREAIRSRASLFTLLGGSAPGGFTYNVDFFNYGGLAHEILDLGGGGTSNLKSIPLDYVRNLRVSKKEPRPIAHKPMRYPVIIVVDNDDGLASFAGTLKKTFGTTISKSTTSSFYHITDNLYVIKTPESGSLNTCIEDLFPLSVLSHTLNGKKFNPSNDINISAEYSKEVFAKSVVRPSASSIDFSGFDSLLARISDVIQDYAVRS